MAPPSTDQSLNFQFVLFAADCKLAEEQVQSGGGGEGAKICPHCRSGAASPGGGGEGSTRLDGEAGQAGPQRGDGGFENPGEPGERRAATPADTPGLEGERSRLATRATFEQSLDYREVAENDRLGRLCKPNTMVTFKFQKPLQRFSWLILLYFLL
jgi:hypothetical protein